MRYAIFSDIHANNQAWEATLADIRANECEVLICLGDAVGYGPKPAEVLRSIRENSHAFVLGNHDAAACGRLDSSYFNDNAKAGIAHTRALLDEEALEFLSSVPYATEVDNLLFVHAETASPDRFDYVETVEKACEDFGASGHWCTFIGHTHHPTVFVEADGLVSQEADDDFQCQPGQRYIINVGSVGEPRNPQDIRARYVIFDDDSGSVYFRRIDFDAEAYRADLAASGSSAFPYFLQIIDHYTPALQNPEQFTRAMHTPAATSGQSVGISKMQLPSSEAVRQASREVTKKSASATVLILILIGLAIGVGWFATWYFDAERKELERDPLGIADAPGAQVVFTGDLPPHAESLFGYWPLDSETRGYAGAATFQGMGVGSPGRGEGRFAESIYLDETSGLVFGKVRTFALREDPMTVSFWLKVSEPSRNEVRVLGTGAERRNEPGWLILLHGEMVRFRLCNGSNWAQIGGRWPALRDGEWHQLAIVVNPDENSLSAFVDGGRIGVLDYSALGYHFSSTHRMRVGTNGNEEDLAGLGGNIDELAIWRRALSDEEIASLFERTESLKSSFR
ncbi:MAG: LamG-like jellyroll fold domain-containing protein [Verrucomicrobiota bacterium]